jgi:dCMP deaminase
MTEPYIRPDWDAYFMEIMEAVSRRATCDRGRSGCVVVRDNHILTTGYVGAPPGLPHCDEVGHQMKATIHEDGHQSQHCVRTTHAEENAIIQAARIGVALSGATMYSRMTPCAVCAKSIIGVGIKRMVCQKRYHVAEETEAMFRKVGIKLDYMTEETQQYAKQ